MFWALEFEIWSLEQLPIGSMLITGGKPLPSSLCSRDTGHEISKKMGHRQGRGHRIY